jgi:DNA-binding NarL/FixJ family response regulator
MKTKDLTDREREVAILTCEGLSAKMVGKRLGVSTFTVQTHRQRIITKMNSANIAQACYRFALWGRSSEMHAIEQNERQQYANHETEIQC